MAWTLEDNEVTGGKELTNGNHSFSLTDGHLKTLQSARKAQVIELINELRGSAGAAPTEQELADVRRAANGHPFQEVTKANR